MRSLSCFSPIHSATKWIFLPSPLKHTLLAQSSRSVQPPPSIHVGLSITLHQDHASTLFRVAILGPHNKSYVGGLAKFIEVYLCVNILYMIGTINHGT